MRNMKRLLSLVLILSFLGILVPFFLIGHHGDVDSINCVVVCISTMKPVVTAAIITLVVAIVAIFEVFAVAFATESSPRVDTPYQRFRARFTRWFSLLEHSPTA